MQGRSWTARTSSAPDDPGTPGRAFSVGEVSWQAQGAVTPGGWVEGLLWSEGAYDHPSSHLQGQAEPLETGGAPPQSGPQTGPASTCHTHHSVTWKIFGSQGHSGGSVGLLVLSANTDPPPPDIYEAPAHSTNADPSLGLEY